MCNDCGCSITEPEIPSLEMNVIAQVMEKNDQRALKNKAWMDRLGIKLVNIMSSPGSGKTRILEETVKELKNQYRVAVIEGDLATNHDALRIEAHGIEAIQVNTTTACHLDAHMIHDALHKLPLDELDLIFIENVGNLVCPAGFDLGQHKNVIIQSVTEGDDKPLKYPVMFRAADLSILNKIDLLPYIPECDPEKVQKNIQKLGKEGKLLQMSAKTGQGLKLWINWIKQICQPTIHTQGLPIENSVKPLNI